MDAPSKQPALAQNSCNPCIVYGVGARLDAYGRRTKRCRGEDLIANTLPCGRNSLSCVGEQCESGRTSEKRELQRSC